MPLRDVFGEGARDSFFRERAEREYLALVDRIDSASITPHVGPDDILESNEVGYFVQNATETLDLEIVFTPEGGGRPHGRYHEAYEEGGRPLIVLFYEESKERVIKRKLLAIRGKLGSMAVAVRNVLHLRHYTFTHEYIHHMDKLRMGPHRTVQTPEPDDSPDARERKMGEYYNSPLEINAYIQQMLTSMQHSISAYPEYWPDDSREFTFRAMRFIEQNYPLAWKYFSEDTKRRVRKRVGQMWLDRRGSG